ncbi:MAG: metal ABC transporter ATP-binding protein [Stellaceae bacterium]
MNTVEFDGVTLAHDARAVLSGVDAAIAEGEFIGVLGPNGAGKTTLLKAILGVVPAVSGEIKVLGRPPHGGAAIGYLPQRRSAIADLGLRGRDYLASAVRGEKWGLPLLWAADHAEIARVLDLVDGQALAVRPLSRMSGGEMQRLLLAKSLMGTPRLLLLDEPLMSLDLHFQAEVVSLIRRVQKELGLTVLFTAHELNPLLGVMDRVFYLGYGRAVLGAVDDVITSEVLTRLYRTPIDVLRVGGRVIIISAEGELNVHAHQHDL